MTIKYMKNKFINKHLWDRTVISTSLRLNKLVFYGLSLGFVILSLKFTDQTNIKIC